MANPIGHRRNMRTRKEAHSTDAIGLSFLTPLTIENLVEKADDRKKHKKTHRNPGDEHRQPKEILRNAEGDRGMA